MTITLEYNGTIKKTFNIKADLVRAMEQFIPSRKQTDFINRVIEHSIDEMKKEQTRKEALMILQKFADIRNSLPKSTQKSEDIVRVLRNDMES